MGLRKVFQQGVNSTRFPYHHRDGLWKGEIDKYAKPICKYCCTNVDEFASQILRDRKDLWAGSDPNWEEHVTGVIYDKMLKAEADIEEAQAQLSASSK